MPRGKGRNAPHEWSMNDFSLGWDNNSPATMLDPRCVTDCKNFNLTNKKGLSKRGGMTKLYASSAGAADVEQIFEYKSPSGYNYMLYAIATKIRSWYDDTNKDPDDASAKWQDVKTSLTTSLNYSFSVHLGSCYITNGTNANVRLYNTTAYTVGIPVPAAAPTTAINASGSLNGDYYHKYTYRRDTNGHSSDGNPSAISTLRQPDGTESIDVTVAKSTDTNVNHIVVYRTLASGSLFYKVVELANPSGTITGTGIAFVDSNPDTITDTGTGFVTAGFAQNDVITVSGTVNNNGTYTIATVAAGTLTLIASDTLTAEGAGSSFTITSTGYTYNDDVADNDLTTDLETDNDEPPKAKFTCVHKDRMFYANCPDETDGEYLVVWSKSGLSECVPAGVSGNWQYFDRADGEPITGITSVGDFLLVFKRNKISIIRGDLDDTTTCELYSIAIGIGSIASWAIMPFEDKVVFLSEEGWKACDGQKIFSLSENINGILADGWITENENANISAIWYHEKSQFQYNINHSTLGQRVFCGHFLIPLLLVGKGVAEQETGALVAWTYHDYDSHELTCLGTYTDSDGITQPIAGDNAGWIYVLDSGTADTGADDVANDIACKFQTDWLDLKVGRGLTKTCRRGYLDYVAAASTNLTFNIEKDFSDTDDTQTVTGTGGVGSAIGAKLHLSGTGKRFRYTITQDDNVGIDINGISIYFRIEGRR